MHMQRSQSTLSVQQVLSKGKTYIIDLNCFSEDGNYTTEIYNKHRMKTTPSEENVTSSLKKEREEVPHVTEWWNSHHV